jgi:glutathione S-transferase
MKLLGTTTSPYVRRVRIVAAELGVPCEVISTATEAGQSALRTATPIRKVPTALFGDEVVFDSHVIIERLAADHGWGPLRPPAPSSAQRWREANLCSAIDGALDAGILVFYGERDEGIAPGCAFLEKQRARVADTLAWVASQLRGGQLVEGGGFGLAEVALVSTLDWMRFREVFDSSQIDGLDAFSQAHAGRPSVAATYPVAA